ncbi:MAG: cytochrome-c peroxidase [Acidiferrobacteraceae bacterium]
MRRHVAQRLILGIDCRWLVLAIGAVASAQAWGSQRGACQIAFGRMLFRDKLLSIDHRVSCASCHRPDHAFSDDRAVSRGVYGRTGTRNAPSLLDLRVYSVFFWDGHARTLAAQARFPFLARTELGLPNTHAVVARVEQSPRLIAAFRCPHNRRRPLRFRDIAQALTAYERTLGGRRNALDRYLAGDHAALSPAARRGLDLFRGKAHCVSCHRITARTAPLTDNRFHTAAQGLRAIGPELPRLTREAARLPKTVRLLESESNPKLAALGRYLVTLNPKDIGTFRTPSLRNVAETAPYMHNGAIATLRQAVAVELYYRALRLGHPIILSPRERHDLRVFLRSLSAPSMTAYAQEPSRHTPPSPRSRARYPATVRVRRETMQPGALR